MRDHVDTTWGPPLRRRPAAGVRAVLTAFSEPSMTWQTAEPASSPAAARRWIAAEAAQRDSGTRLASP
ncbi:hypothetical protein [Streptomyces sp. NPDC093260]|uniref:hypothetical protein n=1 Tax=Streptomyces sp. NPDC093260 TaxID=3155073 RepID=UPI0034182A2C